MRLSVITVSYNASKTIESTIQSVINQTYTEIEYIIIDGNSTDGTQEVVAKYEDRIDQFISEPDAGIYFGMNKGISMATGDVIAVLNADDIYQDNGIVSKIMELFSDDEVGSVYGDLDYVDEIDLSIIKRRWKAGAYSRDNFLEGWMPPHPTFFIRKKYYDRFGTFNTQLISAADYELMLRMLFKNRVTCKYLPEIVVKMRVGGVSNSSLSNRIRANKEDRRAWSMNGLKPKWYTLFKKPLSKLRQFI